MMEFCLRGCGLFVLVLLAVPTRALGGSEAEPGAGGDDPIRLARAQAIAQTKAEIEALIERYGGLKKIRFELEPFLEEVLYVIEEQRANGARTFEKGGNYFNKDLTQAALEPEWKHPDPARNSIDAIVDFDRKLKSLGVDLIVCLVPSKIEAYPEDFETEIPAGMPVAVGRLIETLKLLEADVEAVDLLPTLLATKTADDAIPVYERSGHHISGIGVRRVAELIQKRLDRYAFEGRDPTRFTDERRTATERVSGMVPMEAWPVLDRGQPYEHVPDSEIVVIGDSHAFAYLTASWACQTARCAGIPITDLSVSSGASTAHKRLASQGRERLARRRVVIWVITSVALTSSWDTTEIPERPTLTGLIVSGAVEEAIAALEADRGEIAAQGVRESELDELGRELLRKPETAQKGVRVLEINTLAFPDSAMAFYNLGNAYLMIDEREKASRSLKKALALNLDSASRANAIRLMKELDAEYIPPEPYTLTDAARKALVGEYAMADGDQGFVRIVGSGLVFEYVGQPELTLEPLSDLRFTTAPGFLVEFLPGQEGEALRVRLALDGRIIEGRRLGQR